MPNIDPKLSIVIVNWNTRELLCRCLDSIYSTVSVPFEIIAVDNDSRDHSAEMVEDLFPRVNLIRSKTNAGFAAGNNLGITKARGEYVMLLNPDAELQPDAAHRLIEFADAHPEFAVVGPKLLNTDGSLQKNGQKFPTLLREALHLTRLYVLMRRYFDRELEWGRENFDVPTVVDCVCGACMLVRRSAIDQVGLLDERFFMYYEEVDWCFRMRKKGWKVYYLPEAQVIHHVGSSSKQTGLRKMQIAYQSQFRYFRKHHGMLQSDILWALSRLALLLMYIKRKITSQSRT